MFILKPQKEYALIDAGDGLKLERYGEYLIARPDPQALWPKGIVGLAGGNIWPNTDAIFAKAGNGGGSGRGGNSGGRVAGGNGDGRHLDEEEETGNWIKTRSIPDRWPVKFEMGDGLPALHVYARLTPFKHTGIFPEQFTNWKWSMELIKKAIDDGKKFSAEKQPKILNLFGYSGAATAACLLAGAHVTHVDSSKGAVTWANENAELAGVLDKPVRWILEDAVSFIKKEVRRGNKYDGIILDPPAFGRGAKGEVWKIEKDFLPFLELIFELMSEDALFLILNGYAAGYSSIAYAQNLNGLVSKKGGEIEYGELCIEQDLKEFEKMVGDGTAIGGVGGVVGVDKTSSKKAPILLPCGITARWKNE
ncbi:MAG: class I SAM-dependent methyltransferase [bacterium]